MTFHSYADIGKRLSEFGMDTALRLDELIPRLTLEQRTHCVFVAVLDELKRLRRTMEVLPEQMVKAQHAEELALEKAKQKTAKAQEKANAALPPNVTLMTLSNEDIERAVNNGRAVRRF